MSFLFFGDDYFDTFFVKKSVHKSFFKSVDNFILQILYNSILNVVPIPINEFLINICPW